MGLDDLAVLAQIAATQDGVFTIAQAESMGVDRSITRRAAARGVVAAIRPGVYRFAGTPLSTRRVIRAAVLSGGEGAVASHESCLHLHQVPGIPVGLPVIAVAPGRRANHSGIRVHRLVDQHPEHRITIDGIATTTLGRGVVDVSSVFSRQRMEWVLDQVTISKRSVTPGAIARVFRQVNHRGRRGIGALGELLDARIATGAVERSTLERELDRLLDGVDLPSPVREYPVPSLVPGEGFADRAWVDAMLILEIDGRTYHERRVAMRRDRQRDRAAGCMGWHTMRVLDEEVSDEPDLVVEDIVGTYRRRLDQLRPRIGPV